MTARRGPSELNALIAIDKPLGLTSHDVVSRVRRAVGERRVGHAGTLDPAATGVLVVGIGQATKLLGLLTLDRKGYRATFSLGSETTTDDAEGEVTSVFEVPGRLLDPGVAVDAVAALEGEHDQVPPAYSAVSVGGRRAYAMARAGEDVELSARHVTIHRASLAGLDRDARAWVVDLDVSKGTYVRSIARDLGRDLGCLAHVSGLRRTFAGPVTLADCVSLEEIEHGGAELVRARCLDPVAALGLCARPLDVSEVVDVMNGRPIEPGVAYDRYVSHEPVSGERVCLTWQGALAGVWERRGSRLACQTNFPQAIEGVAPALRDLGPEAALREADVRALARDALCPGGGAIVAACYDFTLPDGRVGGRVLVPGQVASGRLLTSDEVPDGLSAALAALGDDRRFVCAIGAFDGLHRGHRALLRRAREEAEALGCRLAAVTFTPDPAHVLAPSRAVDLLSVPDRVTRLLSLGVDAVVELRFTTEFASIAYRSFVRDVLGALVDLRAIVVGSDFRLGAAGAGDVLALATLGSEIGFGVVGVDLADAGGAPITASRTRTLLAEGGVEEAAALLGRCHYVRGIVERGRGEGTGFGFPTANVRVPDHACLPAEGVYAGLVLVDGRGSLVAWPAAINVGKPRTFAPGEEGAPFLEATLLGFEGDLYDERVSVVFCRWLRGPRAFGSVEELERVVLGNVDWVRRALGERGVLIAGEAS